MRRVALLAIALAGCAGSQPAGSSPLAAVHTVPAKCTACHLAPKQHSLASERWERFQRNHRRRARLTDEEKTFLYDFLVGGERPAGEASASSDASDNR